MAILNTQLPKNLTEYPNSFKRQGAFPLEAYSVFYATETTTALQEAQNYAKNNPIAYVGQVLAVVTTVGESTKVDVYKIENANGDLSFVGNTEALEDSVAKLVETIGTKGAEGEDPTGIYAEIEAAKDAAIKAILIDGSATAEINEAYDTIKEIAEWIESGDSGSIDLIGRVQAIESDYLKQADKDTIIDRIDGIDGKLEAYTIKSATESEFTVTDGVLAVKAIEQSKVSGLAEALAGKVSAKSSEVTVTDEEGNPTTITRDWILLSPENQDKLSALVIGDNGIEISGKVNASNVEELASWISTHRDEVEGLLSANDEVVLERAIQGIVIGDTTLEVSEDDKSVTLPIATATSLGLVKSVDAIIGDDGKITNAVAIENKVTVNTSGEMEVNSLNVNKLVQTDGDEIILFGGSASSF